MSWYPKPMTISNPRLEVGLSSVSRILLLLFVPACQQLCHMQEDYRAWIKTWDGICSGLYMVKGRLVIFGRW